MTPNILTLKHFHGIKAGTGLDEITINIDEVAGDGQLVLLKGDNGSGKTTVLDNLHPYRIMPSKAGGYSPKSFSYYGQTYGDAQKTLVWTHDGTRYVSEIVIKASGKTKKTEAYLLMQTDDDTQVEYIPYCTPDGVTSDGKTVTYDACVEHILGSPEMFFTAAFSSQGRRQLSTYSNSDIKALMAELLSLSDILALGEKSALVVKLLTARLNGMRQEMTLYNEKCKMLETLNDGYKQAEVSRDENTAALATHQTELAAANEKLAEVKRLAEDQVAAAKKRGELKEQHLQIGNAMTSRIHEINTDIATEEQRRAGVVSRYTADIESVNQRFEKACNTVAEKQKLLQRREEVDQACTRVDELQLELIEQEKAGRDARVRADKLKEISRLGLQKEADYQSAVNKSSTHETLLDTIRNASQLIDDVPCNGTDLQPKCMLLRDANEARAKIPAQEDLVKKADAIVEKAMIEKLKVFEELTSYKDADEEMQKAVERYRDVQQELGNIKAVAALKAAIDVAATELAAAEQERDSLPAGLQETENERDKLLTEIDAAIENKRERIAIVEKGSVQEQEKLQAQIDAIPAGDTTAYEDAVASQKLAQAQVTTLSDEAIQLKERMAANAERTVVIEKEVAGLEDLVKKGEELSAEIAHWQLLTKALGRDGVVALCIDDAGPTLASLTNDLLLSCYGPRFTVSIETQSEKASGDLKEDFDIRVFDGDRNEDKSVSEMSGGERIYINEAMTRAIALYQAQQSGQQYGTLFSDESDGALDPDRKIMFTSMKRKVLELGGYQREIFITHTPELWDLADATIDMQGFMV